MNKRTWVEVDLNKIKYNVEQMKALLSEKCLFMAVVKANGYGHGAVEVAQTALEAGADRLGVALIEEARELRNNGIEAPIHLLTSFDNDKMSEIISLDLIPTIFNENDLAFIEDLKKPIKVHIKIDTGMNRIGLKPQDALAYIEKVNNIANVEIEGLFTHFAMADQGGSPYSKKQFTDFNNLLDECLNNGYRFAINHCANSAATILDNSSHMQMVRIGIALYGLQPSEETRAKINLRTALSWYSHLSNIKKLSAGESISYGGTYTLSKPATIGTVPVGYADGYSRLLSNKAQVLINQNKVNQIGRICMDQFMIDLEDIPAKIGGKITLIGQDGDALVETDDIAKLLNTINYEVVCNIASRVKRVYI